MLCCAFQIRKRPCIHLRSICTQTEETSAIIIFRDQETSALDCPGSLPEDDQCSSVLQQKLYNEVSSYDVDPPLTMTTKNTSLQTTNDSLSRSKKNAHERCNVKLPPKTTEILETCKDLHEVFHTKSANDETWLLSCNSLTHCSEDSFVLPKCMARTPKLEPLTSHSSTSFSSIESSLETGSLIGHGFTFWGNLFNQGQSRQWMHGRVFLLSVWCVYSMVVTSILQPAMPYMVAITLVFLLAILR